MTSCTRSNALHRLGRALGYEYLHSPLTDSGHGFNGVYLDDFLGLGLGEQRLSDRDPRSVAVADVDLVPIVAREGPSPDLRAVRAAIERRCGRNDVHVYRFLFDYQLRPFLDSLRNGSPLHFPFRYKYWNRRADWPIANCYADVPVRVAMHIRRGDITVLKFRGRYMCNREYYNELASVPHRRFEVADYQRVLTALASRIGTGGLAVTALSDGFAGLYRRLAYFHLSPDEYMTVEGERSRFETEFLESKESIQREGIPWGARVVDAFCNPRSGDSGRSCLQHWILCTGWQTNLVALARCVPLRRTIPNRLPITVRRC